MLEGGGKVEPLGMGLGVGGDFVEDGGEGSLRAPVPESRGFGGIEHQPGDIEGPRRGVGRHGPRAEPGGAYIAELPQRHGGGVSAAQVDDAVWRFIGAIAEVLNP